MILLIRASEVSVSEITGHLRKIHKRRVLPRNIYIHSTEEKSASEMALAIRKIVKNKVIHEYPSLSDIMSIFFSGHNARKRNILVTNLDEIRKILKFVKNKHKISFNGCKIEKGSIISIPVNNGSKLAKKIFTL